MVPALAEAGEISYQAPRATLKVRKLPKASIIA